jgi:hypothetical protein
LGSTDTGASVGLADVGNGKDFRRCGWCDLGEMVSSWSSSSSLSLLSLDDEDDDESEIAGPVDESIKRPFDRLP